jgi:hypothetical protein
MIRCSARYSGLQPANSVAFKGQPLQSWITVVQSGTPLRTGPLPGKVHDNQTQHTIVVASYSVGPPAVSASRFDVVQGVLFLVVKLQMIVLARTWERPMVVLPIYYVVPR